MVHLYITDEDKSLVQIISQYAARHNYTLTVIKEINKITTDASLVISTISEITDKTNQPVLICNSYPTTANEIIKKIEQRIKASTNNTPKTPPQNEQLTIGPYKLDINAKTLTCVEPNLFSKNQVIYLTEKEVKLLTYLYNSGEDTVEGKTLLKEVWGLRDGIDTHTLQTHIYRLRQKIDPQDSELSLIITDPTGYRLRR